ncbi:MAG: YceD family protein [Gallionella sp.]|nr:YceD family protein [Gallionella sp.]
MSARSFIDTQDFARNHSEIRGELPVSGMERLSDLLADSQGGVRYALRGGSDKDGQLYLEVEISGICQLLCQRCLKAMAYPVTIANRLLLQVEDGLEQMEGDDQPDSIAPNRHLDVAALLEDEVLLSLPIAPRHAEGECVAVYRQADQGGERHPFAALGQLKVIK